MTDLAYSTHTPAAALDAAHWKAQAKKWRELSRKNERRSKRDYRARKAMEAQLELAHARLAAVYDALSAKPNNQEGATNA